MYYHKREIGLGFRSKRGQKLLEEQENALMLDAFIIDEVRRRKKAEQEAEREAERPRMELPIGSADDESASHKVRRKVRKVDKVKVPEGPGDATMVVIEL